MNKTHTIIPKSIGSKVLMLGVYYKNNAPGGMASVIQYYENYYDGLRYIYTWKSTHSLGKLYYAFLAYLRTIFFLIFDRRIKIIHCHTAADQSFFRKAKFIQLGKLFGKKVILHVHASRFKDFYNESNRKEEIKNILNNVDSLIVLSNSWKAWFSDIIIDHSKLIVLNNITDYPKIKEQAQLNPNQLKVLFLGEIGQRKGVFDLLDVLAKNKEFFEDNLVLKIGGNNEEEKLINTINSNDLNRFVQFEGWVGGEKKVDLLNWADIYILPSYNEGLPIGILEAMSYGCAIISSNVGGIPDIIISYKNGMLINPGNKEEIKKALIYFIENKEQLTIFGSINKEVVKEYYPDYVMNCLKGIYSDLLLSGIA